MRYAARQNPVATSTLLIAAGAMVILGGYMFGTTEKPPEKSEGDKEDEAVARALASLPAPVASTAPVAVRVTAAPGATVYDAQELNRRGALYMAALVRLAQASGVVDPRADIRSLQVIKPTRRRSLKASTGVVVRITPEDRIVRVSSVTQGDIFFLMASSRPSDWPVANWDLSVFPIPLGSRVRTPAGTVIPELAVPLVVPRADQGQNEFSAVPNYGYLRA